MKKIIFITIILLSTFIVTSCSRVKVDNPDRIVSPKSEDIIIKGTWEISDYKVLNKDGDNEKVIEKYMNGKAQFDSEFCSIGREFCMSPKYKLKRVDIAYYLLYEYKIDYSFLNINKDKPIEVISISSSNKPFYDLIKYKDDKMIVYIDGVFFYLNKVSVNTDKSSAMDSKYKNKPKETTSRHNGFNRCGVIIGLKSERDTDEDGNLGEANYRTLWISSHNEKVNSVYEKQDIFFPRLSGFWTASVKRSDNNGYINENIIVKPQDNLPRKQINYSYVNENKNVFRDIKFVGNDYIATEFIKTDHNYVNNFNMFQMLPVDNIENSKGIKISEITGEGSKEIFINSAKSALSSQNKELLNRLDKDVKEENFTMVRRNGHWIMLGKINPILKEDDASLDFNINILPPKKLINYDELCVSWNTIKSKIPEATDAYTSPNEKIALIITKNYIYIYDIEDKHLSDKPLKKIRINEGEKVIMAEWALGNYYVEKWDKAFKEGAKEIKE